MASQPLTRTRDYRFSSGYWVIVPLIASVVSLVPVLPLSLILTVVAFAAALLMQPSAKNRRTLLYAVLIWAAIQAAVIGLGALAWQSL